MTEMTLLTQQQENWVKSTLDSMSIEACAGQLLCPMMPHFSTDDWLRLLDEVPLGTLFIRSMPLDDMRAMLRRLQDHVAVPLLVAGDLEHGAIAISDQSTSFPWTMAMAAANDVELMRLCGQATAIEGRHAGLNWSFSPVIDLNLNFNNPITNIRALSDDPDRVIRLAVPLIEAMQQHGMMATAKHFPGDGVDDRDHHLSTSYNTLPMDQWWELYGKVWRAVIDAGVRCVMPGHIGLPDYQGYQHDPEAAPPATLDPKLLQTLLREELGFDGLIVSDASPMNGLATRLAPERRAVDSIKAGIDVYLFPNTVDDYHHIIKAVHNGDLPEERLRDAARRVLEAKASLHLDESFFGPQPAPEQTNAFRLASDTMAEKSVTVIKQGDSFPVDLPTGAKALTVTIGQINPAFGANDLDEFDAQLKVRGYRVTHLLNPNNDELRSAAKEHDAVFINVYTVPYATPGTIRTIVGHFNNWGWRSLYMEHDRVYYTSFGSPYLQYELPSIPNLLATFGGAPEQQRAAVKVWFGEINAQGDLPVKLPQTRIQRYSVD